MHASTVKLLALTLLCCVTFLALPFSAIALWNFPRPHNIARKGTPLTLLHNILMASSERLAVFIATRTCRFIPGHSFVLVRVILLSFIAWLKEDLGMGN